MLGIHTAQIADEMGRLLTTEAEQEARMAVRFNEFVNRPPLAVEAYMPHPDPDIKIIVIFIFYSSEKLKALNIHHEVVSTW